MTKLDRELFEAFLEEASGYLPEIKSALDAYFANRSQTESLQHAYRMMHTISGASAMLGLTELSDAARGVENLLDEVITGKRAFDHETASRALDGFTSTANQLVTLADALVADYMSDETFASFVQSYQRADEAHIEIEAPSGSQDTDSASMELPDFRDNELVTELSAFDFNDALLTVISNVPAHSEPMFSECELPPFAEEVQFDELAQFDEAHFDEDRYAEQTLFSAGIELAGQMPFCAPPQFDESPAAVATSPNEDSIEAIDPEMIEVFQEEAEEHLRTISAGLEALTGEPENRDVLQEIRRSTHTLKGAAGVVGLMTVSQIAHRMEDLLDRFYENHSRVERDDLNLLMRSTDLIEHLSHGATVENLRSTLDEIYAQYDSLFTADSSTIDVTQDEPALDEPAFAGVSFDDAPREAEAISEILPNQAVDELHIANDPHVAPTLETFVHEPIVHELEATSVETTSVETTRIETARIETSETENVVQSVGKGRARGRERRVVRVPLEQLDRVVKLVGELVISRTTLENRIADLRRENEELQRSTERLRRVSAKLESEYETIFLRSGTKSVIRLAAAAGAGGSRDSFGPVPYPSQLTTLTAWTPDSVSEHAHGFDELEFDRYTEFHRLSRELSEASTDAAAVHSELGDLHSSFENILLHQRRLTNEVQQGLMRVRMVPLSTLATRLERTVRVAADAEGKAARLLIEGGSIELDTTVIDQISDPLLHILRNSVSHGIERAEVRSALGKTETGTIRLRAAYEGAQVIIEISDDGGGINTAAVKMRAIEAGLFSEERVAQMTDRDVLMLIFLQGLSTAQKVSEISGRGIGMDVVRDAVERLQGTLDLDSKPGIGTRMTLRLPLTLAATRALMLRAYGETYALPVTAVQQVIHADREVLEEMRRDGVLRIDGAIYPVIHLTEWLQLADGGFAEDAQRAMVLVLRAAGHVAALVVEEIAEGREIVVKSLGMDLRRIHGIIGATVTGDGRMIPILNPDDIVRGKNTVNVSTAERKQTGQLSLDVLKRAEASHIRRVMIVDDSPSVRRVMTNLIRAIDWIPVAAKDGLDALEILQGSPADEMPSVILLDVEMPRMDGYELLATLRQQETLRHIPVVMITSRTGEEHRRKAISLGATEYLTKPYQDEVLLAHIARLSEQTHAPQFV